MKGRDAGECLRGEMLEGSGRAGGTKFVLEERGHHPQVGESVAPVEAVQVRIIQNGDAG